jgi:hypothetical protein
MSEMTDLEAVRLHALQDYAILDTPREEAFDRIVHLAAVALDMPVVLIPFLDEERQWFKASYGIPISQTARTAGLCHETIKHANVTIVRDIHADPRYQDPGFIAGDRSLRFYAAAPLVVPGGEIIGTLCVMDRKLRPDFGARETEVLKDLAALVLNQLGLRRDRLMLERERDEISLIRDIAGLLTDTCSFEAALQASMRKIVGAMGGAYCEIWERHEGESAARLIAFIAADAAREERFAPMQTRLRKALTELATTALFAGRPGRMVHVLGLPDRADPRRGQAFTLGIHAFVACSLNAGDKRFVLLVAYDAARQDLEAKAAQLERVSHAMQPVLQRKLHDEKLELLSSALEATYDAVCILAISPTDASRHSIAFVNAAFSAASWYATSSTRAATSPNCRASVPRCSAESRCVRRWPYDAPTAACSGPSTPLFRCATGAARPRISSSSSATSRSAGRRRRCGCGVRMRCSPAHNCCARPPSGSPARSALPSWAAGGESLVRTRWNGPKRCTRCSVSPRRISSRVSKPAGR